MSEVIVRDSIERAKPRGQKVEKSPFSLVERKTHCAEDIRKIPSCPGLMPCFIAPGNHIEESMLIRKGVAHDHTFIRKLSARVFARFGPYETALTVMAGRPEVYTLIAETDRQRIGFAMYTFGAQAAADLLAIAVLPRWQKHGAGKLLLNGVEAAVRDRSSEAAEASVRLSVAQDNIPARRLFERCGYQYLPEEKSVYPGGQPSIAMRKRLLSNA